MRHVLAALVSVSLIGVQAAPEVSASVIDQTAKSVYLVNATTEHGRTACTGFLIADMRVLTAAHCLGEQMTVAGQIVTDRVGDEYYDLALLTVPGLHGVVLLLRDIPVVRFSYFAALGHAYGWQRLSIFHVRLYHIDLSPAEGMRPGLLVKPGYIGGMSGGPLIDVDGRVAGICQASNQDLGYGIGATLIRAFLVGLL